MTAPTLTKMMKIEVVVAGSDAPAVRELIKSVARRASPACPVSPARPPRLPPGPPAVQPAGHPRAADHGGARRQGRGPAGRPAATARRLTGRDVRQRNLRQPSRLLRLTKRKVHRYVRSDERLAATAGRQRTVLRTHQGRQQTLHQGALVAAVFRCADTDVASEVVFGQSWGSLIDVSTWGHVVDTGVLGTLSTPSTPLDVPLIVVLGHHNCGAMRAAMRAWQNAELPDGASRLAVEQALSSIVRLGSAADSADEVSPRTWSRSGCRCSSAHPSSPSGSMPAGAGSSAPQPITTAGCGLRHGRRAGDMGDALLECV